MELEEKYGESKVRGGPRRELHFDPSNENAAIVTCLLLYCLQLILFVNVSFDFFVFHFFVDCDYCLLINKVDTADFGILNVIDRSN